MSTDTIGRPQVEQVEGFTVAAATWWTVTDQRGNVVGSANRRELVPLVIQAATER